MSRLAIYTERTMPDGKRAKGARVGVAFPTSSGGGYNIKIDAMPPGEAGKGWTFVAWPDEPRDAGNGGTSRAPVDNFARQDLDDDYAPF